MRILAITVAGLVALAPFAAQADQRSDLQLKGEQQAKDGRFADAIDSFKAADRIQPRASHACLIALAYTRRELWSQAQLWLSICHQRASADDPLPDWTPLAEKQIEERLDTSNVAAVTIVVKPQTVKAKVTVSSFAPDEVFEPRTIHLAPGTHVVFAKAEGLPDRQQTFELRDKTPQTVTIDYSDAAPRDGTNGTDGRNIVTPPTTPAEPSRPSNAMSTGLIVGGVGVLIFGGAAHILMAVARRDMVDATKGAGPPDFDPIEMAEDDYATAEKRFDRWRALAIGGYIVGAGLVVSGYLLRKKVPSETSVSAVALPEGGAFVSVGWSR